MKPPTRPGILNRLLSTGWIPAFPPQCCKEASGFGREPGYYLSPSLLGNMQLSYIPRASIQVPRLARCPSQPFTHTYRHLLWGTCRAAYLYFLPRHHQPAPWTRKPSSLTMWARGCRAIAVRLVSFGEARESVHRPPDKDGEMPGRMRTGHSGREVKSKASIAIGRLPAVCSPRSTQTSTYSYVLPSPCTYMGIVCTYMHHRG